MGKTGSEHGTRWAAMNSEWAQEVAAVLESERLPWTATACWCNERGGTRCAEVTHHGTGSSKQITLTPEHLGTPAARRAEIIRQLQGWSGAERS